MKIENLFVFIILAFVLSTPGCATGTVSSATTASHETVKSSEYPSNTVVIRNDTPYSVDVLGNGGVPWKMEKRNLAGELFLAAARAFPHETLVLNAPPMGVRKGVTVQLNIIKAKMLGCIPNQTCVGSYSYNLDFSLNEPAKMFVISQDVTGNITVDDKRQ